MSEIEQRAQRAAESILENEALTAGLDDAAADVLLNWGITLTQNLVHQTVKMDEIQAEETMYRPMRALRKMLRAANKWALDPQERNLGRFLQQAAIIYPPENKNLNIEVQNTFIAQIPAAPLERLKALQRWVEGPENDPIERINRHEDPGTINKDADAPEADNVSIFE